MHTLIQFKNCVWISGTMLCLQVLLMWSKWGGLVPTRCGLLCLSCPSISLEEAFKVVLRTQVDLQAQSGWRNVRKVGDRVEVVLLHRSTQEVSCVIVVGWNVIMCFWGLVVLFVDFQWVFSCQSKFSGDLEWASFKSRMVLLWVCPGSSFSA